MDDDDRATIVDNAGETEDAGVPVVFPGNAQTDLGPHLAIWMTVHPLLRRVRRFVLTIRAKDNSIVFP